MLHNHIKIATYIKYILDTMVHIIEYKGNETEKCQNTFTLWVPSFIQWPLLIGVLERVPYQQSSTKSRIEVHVGVFFVITKIQVVYLCIYVTRALYS